MPLQVGRKVIDGKKKLPFDFLEEVAKRFGATFSEEAMRNAIAFELNGEFAPELRRLMEYFATNPDADKIGQVQHKMRLMKLTSH